MNANASKKTYKPNMNPQLVIDFDVSLHAENNRESQAYLEKEIIKFNNQERKVYDHLMSSKSITADQARELYGIRHVARRICSLRQAGCDVQDKRLPNGCKEYFVNEK